ncbi:MAG TPA: OsmC family protein [Bacteroidia bacterium]|nr:OsmC family protein [Bacteroidia bacterium]
MDSHYYNVNLKWLNNRTGEISSPELQDVLQVATPPQFAKGIEHIWSPEHLFTAAVNSCFMTTFLSIAENSKLTFSNFTCEAKGILEQVEGKYMMTKVDLFPELTLLSGLYRYDICNRPNKFGLTNDHRHLPQFERV